jgi:PAS domain S-box-containing protein
VAGLDLVERRVGAGRLTAAAIFGLQFARSFLSSAARMPRMDKLVLVQMGGWGLALLAALALPYRISTYMVTVLALVSVVTVFALGYLSLRHGFAGARAFFLAWVVLMLGVAVLSLHNVGVLPSNAITANALLIGSALEMVLLSFALGDRINVARRFKEQAQARIAAEHAMVEALSQSQARLQQVLDEREVILENSIVGIAFLSPDGRFKWANKAMSDIFGASRSRSARWSRSTCRATTTAGGRRGRAGGGRRPVYGREMQMRRRDGTPIWVLLSGKAVSRRDLGLGTVWVVMDITERKRLQEQLQSTMSEREAILNNAVVGIVLSVHRVHEWVNDKFSQMLGYPRQVLIGQSSLYIHPDRESWERFGVEARASLIATNGYTCERQLRRRNGELFWVEMGGSCVQRQRPRFRRDLDLPGHHRTQEERGRDPRRAGAAEGAERVAHPVRGHDQPRVPHPAGRHPVGRGGVAPLRRPVARGRAAGNPGQHRRGRAAHVQDDGPRAAAREGRRPDAGVRAGRGERAGAVPRLVEEVWAQHPDTRCEIAVRAQPGVGACRSDEKLLRHIFGNLLSNAIKYSPQGGQVRFDVRRRGELVFEVADQGIGIPADEVATCSSRSTAPPTSGRSRAPAWAWPS